jgi:hypothetical protein
MPHIIADSLEWEAIVHEPLNTGVPQSVQGGKKRTLCSPTFGMEVAMLERFFVMPKTVDRIMGCWLTLDDLDWKRDRLHVRERKAEHSTTYPLAPVVGEAIVDYLKNGRPDVQSRLLFWRHQSGVDVNVIRGWLGHVSLDTTNRYAEINIRMKQEALEVCQAPSTSSVGPPRRPVWQSEPKLLEWLAAL